MQFGQLISNQGMWGAVLATLTFVLLGFFATKMKVFSKEINAKIAKFTITFLLPFLTLWAFMANTSKADAANIGIVLGLSIGFYLVFAVITTIVVKYYPRLIPKIITKKAEKLYTKTEENAGISLLKYKEAYIRDYQAKLATSFLMLSYGSLQFFAVPLVQGMQGVIFNSFANALLQVWNIPFMIGAFSYVLVVYSGQKITKDKIKPLVKQVMSPTMILLFLSLFIWALQWIPGLDVWYIKPGAYVGQKTVVIDGQNTIQQLRVVVSPYASEWRLSAADFQGLVNKGKDATIVFNDYTFKFIATNYTQFWGGFLIHLTSLARPITTAVSVVSPFAWIIIGGSLATASLKSAAKDLSVWVWIINKLVVLPLIVFLITLGLVAAGAFKGQGANDELILLNANSAPVLIVLLSATPPATVCVIYSVAYNHKWTAFTSQVSALSTIGALIAMPIWVLISKLSFDAVYNALFIKHA
ncbi:hypothetical protein [Mycoplasmopsis columbina]|uniref:hypothetical protein n=1 Tax=Mycoplasmopsis columbina TaxID=114881 RepID=UPI0004A71279|nr:hypothetical protein [Mycoplasmopsis columbina]VEU76883.1 Uncharacterised protein [Mycoplasmopsis columbina]